MSLSRILPEFGTKPATNTVAITDVSLEEQKLNSFEAGYQAGWDDSAAANKESGHQVSADFAQNMGDISMTYHEAYAALFADIKSLLTQIVDAVLPEMAREALGPRLLEIIETELSENPRNGLVVSAAPEECKLLQPMLDDVDASLALEMRADATLSSGQVRLSFSDDHEQELDTAALVDGIQAAMRGFFQGQTATAEDFDTMKETA